MKKNIFISVFILLFIFNIPIVMSSVKDASILFFEKIFVSVFPFMILSDILFYYDYHIFLSNSFIGKFISKIFNLDEYSTMVFLFSVFTSQPNNSIYIKKALDEDRISLEQANNLLIFTYFPSISFTIGSVGILMFNSFKIGLIFYLNALFNNILICLFLKKNKNSNISKNTCTKDSLINEIKKSILNAFNSCMIVLGNLIIFSIIINIFKYYLNNNIILLILSSLIEITNSLNLISNLDISLILKIFFASFSINFSGLSILFQSFSILGNYKLNIKKILIIKLIFSLITSLLLYFGIYLFNLF